MKFLVRMLILLLTFGGCIQAQITGLAIDSFGVLSWNEDTSSSCGAPFYYRITVGTTLSGASYGNSGYLTSSSIPSGSSKTFDVGSSALFSLPNEGDIFVTLDYLSLCGWESQVVFFTLMGAFPSLVEPSLVFPKCGDIIGRGLVEVEWDYGTEDVFYAQIKATMGGSLIFNSGFFYVPTNSLTETSFMISEEFPDGVPVQISLVTLSTTGYKVFNCSNILSGEGGAIRCSLDSLNISSGAAGDTLIVSGSSLTGSFDITFNFSWRKQTLLP